MIRTYTVRDPNNPNVLLDIDVKEEAPIDGKVVVTDADGNESFVDEDDLKKSIKEPDDKGKGEMEEVEPRVLLMRLMSPMTIL